MSLSGDYSTDGWFRQTKTRYDGTDGLYDENDAFAAQAIDINAGQKVAMDRTITISEDTRVIFKWKVDSKAGNKLKFYVDDMLTPISSIEGTGEDWSKFASDVIKYDTGAIHTLRWEYDKTVDDIDETMDTCWVDDIEIFGR